MLLKNVKPLLVKSLSYFRLWHRGIYQKYTFVPFCRDNNTELLIDYVAHNVSPPAWYAQVCAQTALCWAHNQSVYHIGPNLKYCNVSFYILNYSVLRFLNMLFHRNH